jgi:hypothetical protein
MDAKFGWHAKKGGSDTLETVSCSASIKCPRNHNHKQICSSANTMAEPEAALALKCKAGFDFESWRKPIAPASVPTAAQPAPSPPTTAAGQDVVVIESSDDDEVQ